MCVYVFGLFVQLGCVCVCVRPWWPLLAGLMLVWVNQGFRFLILFIIWDIFPFFFYYLFFIFASRLADENAFWLFG